MNLAIVSPFPPEISGVGHYGAHLAHGLAASGEFQTVTVLANRPPAQPNPDSLNGQLDVRRVWRRDWPGSPTAILSALAELKPDAVWFNLGLSVFGRTRWANLMGLATPMLARRRGWPTVVTLHEIFEAANLKDLGAANGRLTHLAGQAVTRMVLRADTVCFTLRRYVTEVQGRYGATNLAHVPVGAVDAPELLPRPNLPPEILIFTTYAPYKGLPILLDAFADLLTRQPEVRLTVAGGEHPRFPGYLAQLQAERGDQPNVRWLGPVAEADLREVFGRASLVALPYTASTGASSVIHRAAAFGRPVLVSDLPDMRALAAEEGLRLRFAPPGDRAALAQALDSLLANAAERDSLARHNLKAMQAMTLADTCAAYTSLLRQAASRS